MKKNNFCAPEFFLGANTPKGFYSLFKELYHPEDNWFCYILKGGPGTGKSTLMRNISKTKSQDNINHEIIKCSSDPDSLDAIIFENSKKAIVDGTAPHTIDPMFPGVSDEIINLGEFWDNKILQNNKTKIMLLFKENAKYHKISSQYLTTFGYAYNYNLKIISQIINYEKLNKFCEELTNKLNFKKQNNKNCKTKKRFISSVTPKNYLFLKNTPEQLCDKLFIIQDDYNIISNYIINYINNYVKNLNYNIVLCPCPFSPDNITEALFLTDTKLGFVTKNQFLDQEFLCDLNVKTEIINTKKFIDKSKFSDFKNIINFNSKFCKKFLSESVKALEKTKKIHDELENIYSSSMNYTKINKTTEKLYNNI